MADTDADTPPLGGHAEAAPDALATATPSDVAAPRSRVELIAKFCRRSAIGVAVIGAVSFLGNAATIMTLFKPDGASKEQVEDLRTEISAQRELIAQLLARTEPEFASVDPARAALRETAALRVVMAVPDAATSIAAGDLAAGFDRLRRRAEGNSQDAAQAWVDLGALAYDREPALALEAYRRATAIAPDDADAWYRLANLELEHAGDIGAAISAAERSLDAADDDPARLRARTLLAEFAYAETDYDGAAVQLDAVIAAYRLLTAADPANDTLRRELSDALWLRANTAFETGDLDTAQSIGGEVLAISRARFAADPADLDRQLDVSTALEGAGLIAMERGAFEAAEAAFAESLALDRDRLGRDPDSLRAQRDLSVSLERYAQFLMEAGRPAEAVAYLAESVQVSRNLIARSPATTLFREDLAYALEELGTAHLEMSRASAATEAFTEMVALSRGLQEQFPDDEVRQLILAYRLTRLADATGSPGHVEEIRSLTSAVRSNGVGTEEHDVDLAAIEDWLAERTP